mmetsp:Transcript_40624/g.129574  ORF Transcript_40624/g.129574 Transcript_40624/m.129574 type:complete len:88 (+) Transcript_40624:97-360(+)
MDYVNEDIENMRKEYNFWEHERRNYSNKLKEDHSDDGNALMSQIAEVEEEIRRTRDTINATKSQIIQKDESITQLLSLVVSGGGSRY